MSRSIVTVVTTAALALAAMACNPATAKDRTSVWTSIEALDDEGNLHGRAIRFTAEVDSQARDMETELEITASTTRTGDEQPRVDIYSITTASDLIAILEGRANPSARASDGAATLPVNPNFSACEGEGYVIRDSGTCGYTGQLLIIGDAPRTLVVGGAIKAWAGDDWSGDPESVQVILGIEALSVDE